MSSRMETEEPRLCVRLNEFALPRAIVDYEAQRFVAWNGRFLALTGYSEEELQTIEPAKVLLLGSDSDLEESGDNPAARFFVVALRVPKKLAAIPGHLARSAGKFGYLMLSETDRPGSTIFEEGRLVGQEQARMRIVQEFHEEVSSGLLAAIFKMEIAKQKLAAGPAAKEVSEASEILSEAIENVTHALKEEEQQPEPPS